MQRPEGGVGGGSDFVKTVFPELHLGSTLRAASPLLCLAQPQSGQLTALLEKQKRVQLLQPALAALCRAPRPESGTAPALRVRHNREKGPGVWRDGQEPLPKTERLGHLRPGPLLPLVSEAAEFSCACLSPSFSFSVSLLLPPVAISSHSRDGRPRQVCAQKPPMSWGLVEVLLCVGGVCMVEGVQSPRTTPSFPVVTSANGESVLPVVPSLLSLPPSLRF